MDKGLNKKTLMLSVNLIRSCLVENFIELDLALHFLAPEVIIVLNLCFIKKK